VFPPRRDALFAPLAAARAAAVRLARALTRRLHGAPNGHGCDHHPGMRKAHNPTPINDSAVPPSANSRPLPRRPDGRSSATTPQRKPARLMTMLYGGSQLSATPIRPRLMEVAPSQRGVPAGMGSGRG